MTAIQEQRDATQRMMTNKKKKKKEPSFFQKVVTGVTGKTQKQRKVDALLKGRIKAKQLASYREEQLNQASVIGKAKADIQAKRQIKAMSEQKSTGGLMNLGTWGKAKEGFNPFTFGKTAGLGTTKKKKKKKGKKVLSVSDYLKSVPQ